jgi:starch synthase (maltosyl-transferring)
VYAIEAWTDVFGTWRRDFAAKEQAGLDVAVELEEGWQLFTELEGALRDGARPLASFAQADRQTLLSEETIALARTAFKMASGKPVLSPCRQGRARAGAWYGWSRAQPGRVPGKHGTFDDASRLPDIAWSGIRCRLSHADPSDRPYQSQGTQ